MVLQVAWCDEKDCLNAPKQHSSKVVQHSLAFGPLDSPVCLSTFGYSQVLIYRTYSWVNWGVAKRTKIPKLRNTSKATTGKLSRLRGWHSTAELSLVWGMCRSVFISAWNGKGGFLYRAHCKVSHINFHATLLTCVSRYPTWDIIRTNDIAVSIRNITFD